MQEVAVKTHLIITDVHEEYDVNWCGRFMDADPWIENDLPVFVLKSKETRLEMNSIDIPHIEDIAKKITHPRGRQAVTTDKTCIYLKQVDGTEKLMGIVTHRHIKKYAPMYDKVGYRS